MMEAVLALPPPIRREEEEPEQVAPARVGPPGLEERVVREVMEERVHPHQEHHRDQPEGDGGQRARLDDDRNDPDAEVGDQRARDLPQAATAVGLEIRGELTLPGLSVRNRHCAASYAPKRVPDQLLSSDEARENR